MVNTILNTFFPSVCFICNKELLAKEKHVCAYCIKNLTLNLEPFCHVCSRHISYKDNVCFECKNKASYIKKMYSCFIYNSLFKKIMIPAKAYKKIYLLDSLKPILLNFSKRHLKSLNLDIVSFVPMHWQKLYYKERDQAYEISMILSTLLNIKKTRTLYKNNLTKHQHHLSKSKRKTNLKDCFSPINIDMFKNKNILLVDDVFTTGVTINECAKTLLKAGAKNVYGFSLARGV